MTRKLSFKILSTILILGTAMLPASIFGQSSVTYSSPAYYLNGQSITNLNPTQSNISVAGGVYADVSTFAGTGTNGGTNNSNPLNASFSKPCGITKDALGNYYIAEFEGKRIRKIASNGEVSTIYQFTNFEPRDIVINSNNGDLYVVIHSHRIVRLPNSNSANYPAQAPVHTFTNEATNVIAGSSSSGSTNAVGTNARFNDPWGLSISPDNSFLLISDYGNNKVRKLVLSTMAVTDYMSGLNGPTDVQYINENLVYVSEFSGDKVSKITNNGTTLSAFVSGSFQGGRFDGSGTTGFIDQPQMLTADALGNLYVIDNFNHKVRKITPDGKVSTVAGSLWNSSQEGFVNANGVNARFKHPRGIYYDLEGGFLLVTDTDNHRIRKVQLEGFEIVPAPVTGLSFNASTGVLSGTPSQVTLANQYIQTFNSTSLGTVNSTNVTLHEDAAIHGDILYLTTREGSKKGGITIPATGINSNLLDVEFDLITTHTGGADGLSYSFAPDASATATSPAAEIGTGTKLSISFATYASVAEGIRLIYNPTNINSNSTAINSQLLAYSNVSSWIGKKVKVKIYVDADAKLTMTVDGAAIFTAVQLPADYINSDKSTWKHVIKARTGASYDIHAIDNLSILQGYGTTTHKVIARENNYYNEVSMAVHVPVVPTLSTYGVSSITHNSAVANYAVNTLGSTAITASGVVWGTTSTPTIASNTGSASSGATSTGTFTANMTSLSYNTTYYVRSYVTTNYGYTVYGSAQTFTTLMASPEISYSGSPLTFEVGTAITPLTVTNSGGTIPTPVDAQVSTFVSGQHTQIRSMCMDASGNIYYTDLNAKKVFKSTPSGTITTVAGSGQSALTNGTGTAAAFINPWGIAIDDDANLYVGDYGAIRKITPAGVVSTFATLANAQFGGLAIDGTGNVFAVVRHSVSYLVGNRIVKVTPSGTLTTFAGSTSGLTGTTDATGTDARFFDPYGLAIDNDGNLYVGDVGNFRIRKITPAGVVSTLAGSTNGQLDGTGTAAKFFQVFDLVTDNYNNVYVADFSRIRKITPAGVVTTYAGPGSGVNTNGAASSASFTSAIFGCTIDANMNMYVSQQNGLIRKITAPAIASFTVTPTLPAGLSISNSGTISGTPTIFSNQQNYTITATNIGGSDTYAISIVVNEPVDLTLYPQAAAADEITEVSASIACSFTAAPSTIVGNSNYYNLTPYGQTSNLGNIYSFTVTGTATGGTVWGSNNFYTHDSYIAKAAVHAGILSVGQTGTVYLKLLGSANSYPGSTANGVTTSPWGYWAYSYEFVAGGPTGSVSPAPVTVKGLVYCASTVSTTPTLANATVANSNDATNASYTIDLTGLAPGTLYYARAYATNAGGTYYSPLITFTTPNITYPNVTGISLGVAPLYVYNQYSPSTAPIVYTSLDQNIATVSGNTITIVGAGTATIKASQASQGTSGIYGLIENTFTVTVAKGTPTLTMSVPTASPLNTFNNGNTLAITVNSNSDGAKSLTSTIGTIGGSNGSYTFGDVSGTGSVTFTASVAESPNYNAASISQTMDITKSNQTITFPTPQPVTYSSGATINISSFASASSNLPITYTLGNDSYSQYGASLSGTTLTLSNVSSVTIIASQSGDNEFNAAPPVSRQLLINAGTPNLTVDNMTIQYAYSVQNVEPGYFSMPLNAATAPSGYNGPEYTTNSDGTVNFEVQDPSTNAVVAYTNGNYVWEIPGAGTYNLVMEQAPGTNYVAGTATSTLTVTKADQSIVAPLMTDISIIDFINNGITLFDGWNYYGNTIDGGLLVNPIPHTYVQASYGKSQLKPQFTLESQNLGGVPSATLTESVFGTYLSFEPYGDGTVKLTISQPGDANHNAAATNVVRTFNVVKSNQTLTVDDINDAPVSSIGQSFVFNYSTNANYGINFGLGYPMVVTTSNPNVISWNPTTNELTYEGAGTATITVSQAGNDYYNSATHTQTVTVSGTIPTATVSNTIQNFCAGVTVQSLSAQTNVAGANLLWYLQATGGTALDVSTALLNNTTYYVAQEVNGTESARTAVSVEFYQDLPSTTLSSISPVSNTVTPGNSLNFSVTPLTGATSYVWDLPAGLTISSTSNNGATITVAVSNAYTTGQVKVKALNSCGETPWQTKTVSAPGQSGISITTTQAGAPVICGGTSGVSFSATAAMGATYAWTLPAGVTFATGYDGDEQTTQLNFSAGYVGGTISCVRTTATATNTAYYAVGGLATPGSISGPTALCGLTSGTYTVGTVPNATSYQWQLPTGMTGTSTTSSIAATWTGAVSGTIQVRATGTCGTSAWRTLSVASIAQPSGITGPTIICGAATYTITGSTMTQVSQTTLNYSVTNVSGMTYAWTVPTGMTITSGQGTSAIVVEVDPSTFTSGQVSVTATDQTSTSCVSAARTLNVSKAVSSITGPTALCGVTTATYSVPSGAGSAFSWTLPSWMTPASGYTLTSNPINVEIGSGASTQTLSVVVTTACGNVTLSQNVGCGLFTQLSSASCGSTLPSVGWGISANNVVAATSYQFTLTAPNGTDYTITSADRWITLSEATGMPLLYGEGYAIKVRVQLDGTYGAYGASCTVYTPSLPTTMLSPAFCGVTLGSISSAISANNIANAAAYKFKISIPSVSTSTFYYVESPDRWFALSEAANMPMLYGATYSIQVSVQNGTGVWSEYSTACSVTTLAIPTTSLSTASCGATLPSLSWGISATNVAAATAYRFNITAPGNATPYVVTSPDRWITLSEATGMPLLYASTYSITVEVENGTGNWGASGTACNVITPDIPTIGLSTASCGATLPSLGWGISATNVAAATQYEFQIIGQTGAQLNVEYYVLSPDRWITLSEGMTINNVPLVPQNNQEFVIRVRAYSGTAHGEYAESGCIVYTPVTPQGLIVQDQDPQLYTEQAEGLGSEVTEAQSALIENQNQLQVTWSATATSNPFEHSFKVNLNGAEAIENAAMFTAMLTDMSGKVYTLQTLNKEQLETEHFGQNLAPGMYMLTLSQGTQVQVLRVVKK